MESSDKTKHEAVVTFVKKQPKIGSDESDQAESVLPETVQAESEELPKRLEPTRFGDWEKNGRCIDF